MGNYILITFGYSFSHWIWTKTKKDNLQKLLKQLLLHKLLFNFTMNMFSMFQRPYFDQNNQNNTVLLHFLLFLRWNWNFKKLFLKKGWGWEKAWSIILLHHIFKISCCNVRKKKKKNASFQFEFVCFLMNSLLESMQSCKKDEMQLNSYSVFNYRSINWLHMIVLQS